MTIIGDTSLQVHAVGGASFEREVSNVAQKGLRAAEKRVKPFNIPVNTAGAESSFKRLGEVAAGFAGIKIAEAFKHQVEAGAEYAATIRSLSFTLGATTEETSKLVFVMGRFGISAQAAQRPLIILSRNIESGKKSFTQYFDAAELARLRTGKLTEALPVLAKAYQALNNPVEKNAFLMNVFGRGALQLRRLLGESAEEIAHIASEAEKFGLVLSKDNVDAFKRFSDEERAVSQAFKGLQVQLGLEVIPAFEKIAKTTIFVVTQFQRMPDPVRQLTALVGTSAVALAALGGAGLLVARGLGVVTGAVGTVAGALGIQTAASRAATAAALEEAAAHEIAAIAALKQGNSEAFLAERQLAQAAAARAATGANAANAAAGAAGATAGISRLAGAGIAAGIVAGLVGVTKAIDAVVDKIENEFNPGIKGAREELIKLGEEANEDVERAGPAIAKALGLGTRLSDVVADFARFTKHSRDELDRVGEHFDLVTAAAQKYGVRSKEVTRVMEELAQGHVRAAEKIAGTTEAQFRAAKAAKEMAEDLENVGATIADFVTTFTSQQEATQIITRATEHYGAALNGVNTSTEAGRNILAAYAQKIFEAKRALDAELGVERDVAEVRKEAAAEALKLADEVVAAKAKELKATIEVAEAEAKALRSRAETNLGQIASFSAFDTARESFLEAQQEFEQKQRDAEIDAANERIKAHNERVRQINAEREALRQLATTNLQAIASFNTLVGDQLEQARSQLDDVVEEHGRASQESKKAFEELNASIAEGGILAFSKTLKKNTQAFSQFQADLKTIFAHGGKNLAFELEKLGPAGAQAAREAVKKIGSKDGLGTLEKLAADAVKTAKLRGLDPAFDPWAKNIGGKMKEAAEIGSESFEVGLAPAREGLDEFIRQTEANTKAFAQFQADLRLIAKSGGKELAAELLKLGPAGALAAHDAAERIRSGKGLGHLAVVAKEAVQTAKAGADLEFDLWADNFKEKTNAAALAGVQGLEALGLGAQAIADALGLPLAQVELLLDKAERLRTAAQVAQKAAEDALLRQELAAQRIGIISPDGTINQFATGTSFAPGGLAVVGEGGREIVNVPRGSEVTPAHRTESLFRELINAVKGTGGKSIGPITLHSGGNGEAMINLLLARLASEMRR